MSHPYSPTSGTKTHGRRCVVTLPLLVLTTLVNICEYLSPTGITSLPPSDSCSISDSGTTGAPAVTIIPSNGDSSFQPNVPSDILPNTLRYPSSFIRASARLAAGPFRPIV